MLRPSCYLGVLCVGLLTMYLVSGSPVRSPRDTPKHDTKHGHQDSGTDTQLAALDEDLFIANSTEPQGGWSVTDTIITAVVLGVFFLIVLPLLCFFCQLYMLCKCCCKLPCCCCCGD